MFKEIRFLRNSYFLRPIIFLTFLSVFTSIFDLIVISGSLAIVTFSFNDLPFSFEFEILDNTYDLLMDKPTYNIMLISALGLIFTRLVFQYFTLEYAKSVGVLFTKRIANNSFNYFTTMHYDEFQNIDEGHVIRSLTSDVSDLPKLIYIISNFFTDLTYILVLIILFYFINSISLLVYLTPFAVVVYLIYSFSQKKVKIIAKSKILNQKDVFTNVNESLKSSKEIRVFGVKDYFSNKYQKFSKALNSDFLDLSFWTNFIRILLESSLVAVAIIYVFIFKNSSIATTSIINLSIIIVLLIRLIPILNRLSSTVQLYISLKPIISNLNKMMSFNKADDNQNLNEVDNIDSVELSDLSFKYKDEYIFKNINLNISSKEIIGIAGPSGSGKTTLINLLLGLIEPDKGNIIYKNLKKNYYLSKKNQDSYWKRVSFLPQESIVFNSDIIENIYYDKLANYSIKKLKKISNLSMGDFFFDGEEVNLRLLGNDGSKISGGQKQRVGLSRCYSRDSNFFILDEPTSALDKKNENIILSNFIHYVKSKGNFAILISHSKEALEICDKVYEIKDFNLKQIK